MKRFMTIGEAARLLNLHPQTLRFYEREGLVKPMKRRGRRYFSPWELEWIRCMREIMKRERLSTSAMRRLLKLQPCWKITGCRRRNCHMWGKKWRSP